MRSLSTVGRIAAIAAVVGAIAIIAFVIFSSATTYTVSAQFVNASQLVKGNEVQVGGIAVGDVTDIEVTEDGQAVVTMQITESELTPFREGTTAVIKQASLSGIANRFVSL